jgi:hypothetical protein
MLGVRPVELMAGPPDHYMRVRHASKLRYTNYSPT